MATLKIITWQYRVLPLNTNYSYDAYQEKLNVWGENGWELAFILHDRIIFKRPTGYLRTLDDKK